MRYAVYAQYGKARHFTDAVVAGFPGRVRNIEPGRLAKDCVHVLGGLQFGCLELMREIRARGEPYVFFDRAYFGGGSTSEQIRLTRNAYQKHWVGRGDPGRLAKWGVQLQPWRNECGEFVMLVPPSEAVAKLFGLGDWEARMRESLSACTEREVRVSRKDERTQSPLAERLQGCHAVVTWSSNVAVEALCLGVPAYTGPFSAATPMAGRLDDIDTIDWIFQPGEREAWAASLASGQWTVDEIARGDARAALEQELEPA